MFSYDRLRLALLLAPIDLVPFAMRWQQSPDAGANSSKQRSTYGHALAFADDSVISA